LQRESAKYERIHNGMSLGDVEKILGKGTQKTESEVPSLRDEKDVRKAVEGKEFYDWRFKDDEDIWIGVSDGRVISKYYYFPSL